MKYQPRYISHQYRNMLSMITQPKDRQILYYDPVTHKYYDPQKDAHYTGEEVLELMRKSLLKIVIRFDSKFPK